jgi:PelA/Pel-15E family pectate lyase
MTMRITSMMVFLALTAPVPVAAQVIGTMTAAEPITDARIERLPAAERPAWRSYLARSRALMAADKAALAAERKGGAAADGPAEGPSGGGGMPMDRPAAWYAGPEARRIADTIVSFQTPAGGWGKNQDRSGPARRRGQSWVIIEDLPANAREDIQADTNWRYVGTIDNNATIAELRFLARVQAQLPGREGAAYRAAFDKGVRYLLAAQFPNGGWPQVFPLQGGYHDAVTFNDDAVGQVAMLMLDIGGRQGDFAAVPALLARDASHAAARATAVILRTQVRVAGRRTIWGQQHDALTLAPVGARNFEPAALSSAESADLLAYLMKQPNRSSEVRGAVADGVAWLEEHALRDREWARSAGPEGRRLVAKPGAGPLWARYYDLRTGKPIFGDRDKTINLDVNQLSRERRDGYSWFNTNPAKVIAAYRRWAAK